MASSKIIKAKLIEALEDEAAAIQLEVDKLNKQIMKINTKISVILEQI